MQLLLVLCPLVPHHQKLLLLCVLSLDVVHNFRGFFLFSCEELFRDAVTHILQVCLLELFIDLCINRVFKLTQEALIVVNLLLLNLGLPLPESFQVVVLNLKVLAVALHLLVLIAHNLDHAGAGPVTVTSAHVLNSSEASW